MSKETPLYSCHLKHNAKMVDFVGWKLPVEYEGLVKEHLAVRESVGIFDVSHMGEIDIKGSKALEFVQKITTNNVAALKNGQVQYSLMCYETGGIVDDVLVHRFNENHFFLCVNAANIEKDHEWIVKNNTHGVQIENMSEKYAQIAIQGPRAENLLSKLTKIDLTKVDRYWFTEGELAGERDLIIARTGYTGEDGFEIYSSPKQSVKIWNSIIEAGKEFNIKPCGLGARDTLRLEVRYPLYGNDIDKTTNPFEAGLSWVVSKKKGDFIGRNAMFEQKELGLKRKNVGVGMIDRGIPRKGYELYDMKDNKIGSITSGTFSPSLKKSIALGYVNGGFTEIDTPIQVKIRDKMLKAIVIKAPFLAGTSLDKFMKK